MGNTDYDALRAQTVSSGQDEEAVTVNTRALIDKVLARYSGEWTTLRELLQNAADASASKVTIKFETLPSAKVPLPQDPNSSALLKHTLQHHKLKRLVVTNNGQVFSGNDWSRLKRIAEGNPDETKIGAFGVGFYSVFAECEEPLVRSGNEAMAFYWKGNSLFTRTSKLQNQENNDTSFILDYRNDTTTIPSLLPLCQFLATSLTFVGISDIELFIDDWRLLQLKKTTSPSRPVQIPKFISTKTKDGLFKITSATHETSQLNATWLKVIGWNAKAVLTNSAAPPPKSGRGLQHLWNSITSSSKSAAAEKAAKAEREAEIELAKDLLGEEHAVAFLHVTTAQLTSNVEKNFAKELERATKKPPPKTTRLALLTTSHDEIQISETPGSIVARKADVFANVLPRSSGRIFIGFPTHQTTGLGAHISAPSVIPTVERESIDLNARWVRTWNEEMLRAAGMISRIAWCEESDALKRHLDDVVKASGSSKLSPEHISKIIPQAVHNLDRFNFSEATPSSKVGSCIEEGFWDCDKSGSLQVDLLSTRGVVPCQDIRLMGTDELSFLEGIPFLPKEIAETQPAFIKKLVSVGVIAPVVITDIKRELERQSLSSQQLVEFLQWIAKRVSSKQMDTSGAASLLKVTVANDSENDRVIQLGLIRSFQTPHKIPIDVPVPDDTIPYKFTKNIDGGSLAGLGWEDLQIVPWVKYLLSDARVRTTSKRLDLDPDFAALVLPAISKQWKGLSEGSKQTIKSLLSDRTVIPTKLGMRKPGEAYFKSVKLFEDIPTITMSNLSDAFLSALGVRKTIELNLVFERLLNPKKTDGTAPAWSHVELIKYLVSVRNDIPSNDIKKLQQTAICTAEGEKDGQRYMLSELFEPKDDLRPLPVKFVFWPGLYRPHAEESKFMRLLGLRTHPTVGELIATTASSTNEPGLREAALKYLVMFQHQHGYSIAEIAETKTPFLPVDGDEKTRVFPSACFTNKRAVLFGCRILRQDLHPHAARLGVKPDPPITVCIEWLLKNPPATNRLARELFEYFAGRMNELGGRPAELLSKASIVPILPTGPEEKEGLQSVKRLTPASCFLGRGGKYAEILDYVDFGDVANAFLMRCGSKPEPTPLELAKLVIQEPARILDTLNSTKRYLALLTTIAEDWTSIKKDKSLVRTMRESAFLLASVERPNNAYSRKSYSPEDEDEEQETVRSWQLARADRIVVVDDATDYNLFKTEVLAAPQEEELELLYLTLGASNISSVVTENHRVGGRVSKPEIAQKMKKLVVERVKLFFSDMQKDHVKRDGNWIEKNLQFVPVSGISLNKTLKGNGRRHSLAINALYYKSPDAFQAEHIIYFIPEARDLFDLSNALCSVCLSKTKPQQAIVLTTLLENNLATLQSRGYNVSRILRKKEAEDRIQQEEKQKQLKEERERMAAVLTSRNGHQDQVDQESAAQPESRMPGLFPETPERGTPAGPLALPGDYGNNQQPLLTSFKERMRDIWKTNSGVESLLGSGGTAGSQSNAIQHNSTTSNDTTARQPNQGVNRPSDKASIQAKLERTIKASKPFRAGELQSSGLENMVKETPSFCDSKPAQNIVLRGQTSHSMKIFCVKTLADPSRFLASNGAGLDSFSAIILQVARAVDVPRQSLHIFFDESSEAIAFNLGQAIFFNYHYFDAMHLADVQQGRLDSALTYWFITMCHEITHNICEDHGPQFNFWMQNLVWLKFTAVAKLLRYDTDASATANAGPPPPYRS